ncbi:biotin transporter BioY [Reyranella sp. CPCC 100927]|uniref:biotin transporter BioY n=1 Tax=Reyranella sp. CPCC 100927 TaxID=2599616 RepID=UPI0011B49082|nr:biotin transporter BioY [Reyranella sp. CPCC 100927]TWT11475.1 biotin transporter BioY [Reyranella sp. CPCC 100927]
MTEPVAGADSRPRQALAASLRLGLLLIAGSAAMTLSAKVEIPFWPVPMTLQVLASLALAGIFGGRLAGMMIGLYLLEGALGLPVFANAPARGIGLAYLAGPTGGYLVGFLVAAVVIGSWVHRDRLAVVPTVLKMMVGLAIIYIMGVLWLAQFTGWQTVLSLGVLPFLAGDVVKALLAAAFTIAIARWRRVG